jgi:hypothetical protein
MTPAHSHLRSAQRMCNHLIRDSRVHCNRRYEVDAKVAEAVDRVQAFLAVAENVVVVNYPASAKLYLSQFPGMEALGHAKCRNGDYVFDEQKRLRLKELRVLQQAICAFIGIPEELP